VAALGLQRGNVAAQLTALGERKAARLATHADALLNQTTLIDDLATDPPLTPAELATIDCPVLAVFGARSELIAGAEQLRRYVRAAEVVVLPGLAHTVLREATAPLRTLLLSWLAETCRLGGAA
jgi:pimeloyl-ACP methyl ester carboxylesterase